MQSLLQSAYQVAKTARTETQATEQLMRDFLNALRDYRHQNVSQQEWELIASVGSRVKHGRIDAPSASDWAVRYAMKVWEHFPKDVGKTRKGNTRLIALRSSGPSVDEINLLLVAWPRIES